MICIGVGIDYALFIVTRYRVNLHRGEEPEQAIVTALTTAGRAVIFAGCTVVISLLGMVFLGLSFIRGMAIGASLAVLITMMASVTLLPAVLGFVGHTIDRLGLPWVKATQSDRPRIWVRWSHFIQRRPWPALIVGVVPLVLLA